MFEPAGSAPSSPIWMWVWGLQCWLVWVAGPGVYRGSFAPADVVRLLLPLAVLGGLRLWYARGRKIAPSASLGLFPASLALAVAPLDTEVALAIYSPPVLLVGAGCLLGFAASASQLATAPTHLRAGAVQPLGESHLAATDASRARKQLALLGCCGGGLLLLVVAGSWDSALRYHEAWGEQAAAGATLTAIVAGLVGSIAMAALVGPSLRAERAHSQQGKQAGRMRRVGWLLGVAASGAVTYWLFVNQGR